MNDSGRPLTHRDCLRLLGDPHRRHTAVIAVDDHVPLALACFVCDGGDMLVPTGEDPTLTRRATGRPVAVELSGDGTTAWTIHGVGLARPLSREDRRAAGALIGRVPATRPLALRFAFDNGILVRIARLTGHAYAPADGPVIPAQRTMSAAAVLNVRSPAH